MVKAKLSLKIKILRDTWTSCDEVRNLFQQARNVRDANAHLLNLIQMLANLKLNYDYKEKIFL